jgi:hypothetical protein
MTIVMAKGSRGEINIYPRDSSIQVGDHGASNKILVCHVRCRCDVPTYPMLYSTVSSGDLVIPLLQYPPRFYKPAFEEPSPSYLLLFME